MTEPTAEPGAGDAGTTLIEILMAVILVGIAFVALLAGLGTVALGSDIHRKQADAEAVLTTASEVLRAGAVAHRSCETAPAPAPEYQEQLRARVDLTSVGWLKASVTVVDVRFSDGDGDFGDACYDTAALGHLLDLQLVTIRVVTPDGRATEQVDVVKAAP